MNNGDGTFRDETATRLPQPSLHEQSFDIFQSLDLPDFDGDGSPEIATQLLIPPQGEPAYAAAFKNDGRGRFVPLPTGYPVAASWTNVHAFVDLEGDGHRDLFIVGWSARGDTFNRRRQRGKPIRPGTPTGVRVTRDPANRDVVVAWPYVWGATSYEVSRAGRTIAVTKRMRYVDRAPVAGASYTVRALNIAGRSARSTEVPGPR
jgi:hypothetical protein